MAHPLPSNDDRWIMSAEGWAGPEEDGGADPRWQSVYVVNINDPDDYQIVDHPIGQYPKAPEKGRLYGSSEFLTLDGRYLFNLLYGFNDEGGGIWVADLSEENFYEMPGQFTRIVPWDHALSWIALENKTDGPLPFMSIFLTGKEVADDFAMTANFLRINGTGLDSTVERQERLLRMVGWNPVPFALQRLSERRFHIAVETHFNYESSLLSRAMGVYLVTVDTTQ
jgi:hypothetical protein